MQRVPVLVLLVGSALCLGQSSGPDSPGASTAWQNLHTMFSWLCEDGHGFLVSLFGTQHVDRGLKTMRQLATLTSETVAEGLNLVASYGAEMLRAAGIDVSVPVRRVTPEGVVFVTQWFLLALLVYWVLSLAVCLVAGVVRRSLRLLKITLAVAVFGLILSDSGASAETTAMRLAGLVFACVLLGVGPSPFRGDANTHLEAKVKLLERRLREVEKSKEE